MARQKFLQVGDSAPDFTLPRSNGELVSLSDFRGRSAVVLFFYPKDHSPACTAEACSFRDSYEVFRERGAEVVGISADSPLHTEHLPRGFVSRLYFFPTADGSVRQRYGVAKTFGIFPGRATYLIDRQGVIRYIFSSQFLPLKHVSMRSACWNGSAMSNKVLPAICRGRRRPIDAGVEPSHRTS